MSGFAPAKCPWCGDPVLYATTTSGRVVSVDAKPARDGGIAIHRGIHGLQGFRLKGDARKAEAEAGRLYRSHAHSGGVA